MNLKLLSLGALAAMVIAAIAAGSASATTLEVGGATENSGIEISMSLQSGSKVILKDTAGFSRNECSEATGSGATFSPYTGATVSGTSTGGSASSCTRAVTFHEGGSITLTHIASSTNATVMSSSAVSTSGSAIGTLTCETGEATDLGTLTGVASGNATVDVNAVINCGIIPSAKLEGTFKITSPEGLGVSS